MWCRHWFGDEVGQKVLHCRLFETRDILSLISLDSVNTADLKQSVPSCQQDVISMFSNTWGLWLSLLVLVALCFVSLIPQPVTFTEYHTGCVYMHIRIPILSPILVLIIFIICRFHWKQRSLVIHLRVYMISIQVSDGLCAGVLFLQGLCYLNNGEWQFDFWPSELCCIYYSAGFGFSVWSPVMENKNHSTLHDLLHQIRHSLSAAWSS